MSTSRRICLVCVIGPAFCLFFLATLYAAVINPSKPMICAFSTGFDCNKEDGCQKTSPEAAGLPVFIAVDPANRKVSAAGGEMTGDRRETAIRGIYEAEGKIFLQGIERRGWSAVMNKETGLITVAASSDNEAIVFFGQCMNP